MATVILSLVAPLSAATGPPNELGDLTLEQLLKVQVVSAASRRPQSPKDAPSVVTVVTGEEIRRHGYRTLGDVLRTLPGFYVTNDRNYSYVGVRGFGLPGDYNTRILLLLNGARTNDNIYDQMFVGREFLLDMDLIERLEISEGPGASVYGNNALFAVINVVTRRGRDLAGGRVSASGGSFGTYDTSVHYGREMASGLDVAVSVSGLESAGQTLTFPEFSDIGNGVVRDLDGEGALRAFGSVSYKGLALDAAYVNRHKHFPTASYGTIFGDARARTRDDTAFLSARYVASVGTRLDLDARLITAAYDYTGDYPYETGPAESDVFRDVASGRWSVAEASGTLRAGAHTLLFGGEYQRNTRRTQRSGYLSSPTLDLDVRHPGSRLALYAQDDLSLGTKVLFSLGARFDHDFDGADDAEGDRLNPRLALIVSPDARTTLKLLYGRAFRAANEYEKYYYSSQRPDLEAESIRTLELALQRSLGPKARLTASVYSYTVEQLITLDSNPAGDLFFRNADKVHALGAEMTLEVKLRRGAAGRVGYALQRTHDDSGTPLTNSPRHQVQASLSAPLGSHVSAAANATYMSHRLTPARTRTSGFLTANLHFVATRLPGGLEAGLTLRNAFDQRFRDPASAEHLQASIEQDGRSVRLELSRRF